MSWEKIRLGDVASFINGYAFKPNDWSTKGAPIIRIQDLTKSNGSQCNYYEGEISEKYKVLEGDILISWSATLGLYVWKGQRGWLNQHIFKVVFDKLNIDKTFFIYLIENVLDALKAQVHGATMKHITKGKFDNTIVRIPPLTIQKQIAEILDKADTLRKKDLELLKYYDALAHSLFIDMFGDPVKNEKGWEVKKMSEITSKILSGNTPIGGSTVYVDKGINFFRSQNVWKNKLVYDGIAYIDNATHAKMKNSSLMNKDILITKTGRINTENSSLGRAALFLGEDNSANINGHVYLIRLNTGNSHEFVLKILTSLQYRDHIRNVCVGGIDKRQLNKEHIEDFPIIYPPISLQNQFAEQIKNIELQKEKVKEQIKASENLFQALLQKMFS